MAPPQLECAPRRRFRSGARRCVRSGARDCGAELSARTPAERRWRCRLADPGRTRHGARRARLAAPHASHTARLGVPRVVAMSFILDALKKSEIERQRQSVPGLMDAGPPLRRARFPAWAIALAALLAVNLAV